jgi:hypothetical protein
MESTPPQQSRRFVIHKVYAFYLLFYGYSKLFPKKDKLTLAARIEQNSLELLELLLLAQTKQKKGALLILNKCDLKAKTLRLLIRMAYEIKAIDQRKYLVLEEKLLEIGRLIGGWIKKINTPEPIKP